MRPWSSAQTYWRATAGHALAAGFTILEDNIPLFRHRMQDLIREDTGGEANVSTLKIDGEIENTAVLTVEEVEALSMLEPYGAGNPKPIFSLSGVTVTCMTDVGRRGGISRCGPAGTGGPWT